MTIIFFARRFYPHIGGVEKHVMEVGKRLVSQGHRVLVINESITGTTSTTGNVIARKHETISLTRLPRSFVARNDKISGIETISIPVGKEDKLKKFRIWKNLWALRDLIRQADVIHCHDVFFWYAPFRFLYPRKRVYTTFHGYESYPIRKSAIVVRKISEKLSNGNICIGDFIAKWYGTKPTYVSYGAVESLKIKEKRLKIENRESALFFGRLDQQTGILEYVEAVQILKKKYPKFELLVVGDGEYKKKLEKKVKTIGFQVNPEKYFEKYHFAFVSRYLSILEAFAAKRLVFALYDNPVKEDYLKMAPYARLIIIENNPQDLAKKIEYFLNNPEKEKEMVDKAYEWVKKQSWDEMVRVYLKLWNRT